MTSTWALVATWIGMAITGFITLYNVRANREKTEAETAQTKVDTAQKSREAAAFDEKRERDREAEWQKKIDECETKLNRRIDAQDKRLSTQQRYIEKHVPWDWKAVRELRLQGVEIEDPPTLVYLPHEHGSQ